MASRRFVVLASVTLISLIRKRGRTFSTKVWPASLRRRVNAVEVIENAIASVAPSARAKCITINKAVEGQPRTLRADATRLEQVAWNLLSNAIKFTPENGSIGVALRWTESRLEITVTDTGEGIGPDLLPYIFDPFRQGQSGGTRKGGLGLGLSIVKSLVELHGGAVRAESAGAGAGATFIVELPLVEVSRSKDAPPAIGRLFIARSPMSGARDGQQANRQNEESAYVRDGVARAS